VPHRPRTAFAIGGLGGNNAHGAGFLTAAQELQDQRGQALGDGVGQEALDGGSTPPRERVRRRILPELEFVSCTSGAIATTATYLRGGDIREQTERGIEAVERVSRLPRNGWADDWRGLVVTLLTGVPSVFGPYAEAYRRHLWRRLRGFLDPRSRFFLAVPTTPEDLYDLVLPAAMFVPKRAASFFDETAQVFTDPGHGVGVAFNAFDPATGLEQLYVNEAALNRIAAHYDPSCDYGRTHRHTVYRPITPEAVRAALWLVGYGFPADRLGPDQLVDGAYARSMILSELTGSQRIYAVKPTNDRWIGRLPQNAFEVQDMQTEFWWEASYREQARLIDTINDLQAAGRLTKPVKPGEPVGDGRIGPVRRKRYRAVELVPVEIEMQRGFFDYFVEDRGVFTAAYAQSLQLLTQREEQHRVGEPEHAVELT